MTGAAAAGLAVGQPPAGGHAGHGHSRDPHAGHVHIAGPDNDTYVVHGDHLHREVDSAKQAMILWGVILVMMGLQGALWAWKRTSPRSYQLVSLAGMYASPVVFGLLNHWYRFLVVWVVYAAATAWFLHLATRKPLAATAPRLVYAYFNSVYNGSLSVAASAFFTLFALGFIPVLLRALPSVLVELLASGLLYGLYFGVLARDTAEVAADTITMTLGYRKKDDDDTPRPVPRNICALCGGEMRSVDGGGEAALTESGIGGEDEEEDGDGGAGSGQVTTALERFLAGDVGAFARLGGEGGTASGGQRQHQHQQRPGAGGTDQGPPPVRRMRGADGGTLYKLACDHT
jgi:hypothetical protein